MPKEYIPAPEMDDYVQSFIEALHEFTTLREHEIRFRCVYTVATDKDGNPVSQEREPILMKKVSDLMGVLLDAQYVLDIDDYDWSNMESESKRRYWLHRTLSQIDVFENEKGKVTIKKHEPEVVLYVRTMQRYPEFEGRNLKPLEDFDSEVFKFQFKIDEDIALARLVMPKAISHATVRQLDDEDADADGERREEPSAPRSSRRRAEARQEPEEPEETGEPEEQEAGETDQAPAPRGAFDPTDDERETARVRVHTDDAESQSQKTAESGQSRRRFVGRTQRKMREALTS